MHFGVRLVGSGIGNSKEGKPLKTEPNKAMAISKEVTTTPKHRVERRSYRSSSVRADGGAIAEGKYEESSREVSNDPAFSDPAFYLMDMAGESR